MIDTKELRRKLRSDDLMDHVDIHANVKPVLTELINRLEAAEKSDAESLMMYRKARGERDELRAKIVGLINAPATKIAQLANAPAAKLARVFGAYANRDAA